MSEYTVQYLPFIWREILPDETCGKGILHTLQEDILATLGTFNGQATHSPQMKNLLKLLGRTLY